MGRDIVRYTPDQLHHLRDSHLVQKPDGLPSIEQWMDPQPDQASRRPRSQVLRDGEQPANGEARTDRPILSAMGMGNFGRRPSTQPEDTILAGPPKLSFTSTSRTTKLPDGGEKRSTSALDSEGSLADRIGSRERWSKDRFDPDRVREKPGYLNGRRGGREEGEGWTNVRSRKSLGQDEIERPHRNGDRDRDRYHKDGDLDNGELGSRRSGLGRGRFDQPWGREDSGAKEGDGAKSGTRGGQGWRDRERDKERDQNTPRDRDRDWNRGRGGAEEDPEWMDTPLVTEKKPAKTQEDFQRWKEAQTLKTTKPQDKKEPSQELAPSAPEPALVPVAVSSAAQQKAITPFAMDVGTEKLFGMWGEGKRADSNTSENATLPRVAKAKPKPSRFAGLFSPPDDSATKIQIPIETPTSPAPATNRSSEDKEGFQRILQMLGGTNISNQPNLGTAPSNGTRQGVRLDFQHPQGEEGPPLPPHNRHQLPRARDDRQYVDNLVAPKPSVPDARSPAAMFGLHSPENESGPDQYRLARPDSGRPAEDFPFQPPSRNGGGQDAMNLQALLQGGSRASQDPFRDSKRDFLLTLMQQPSRGTPPQMSGHNPPRQPPDNSNFLAYMDNNALKAQGLPKHRGPPPGMFDDPRLFADSEMLRREANIREAGIREANMRDATLREATIREANMREAVIREANIRETNIRDANIREASMRDDQLRKTQPRPPPGIYDDPSIASLTRRNTTENMPRQPTNMGIPQQPVSDLPPWMKGPGLPQPSQERNVAPPPGFPPTAMRQPPGFGGPQVGSQPPMPPFSAGNTPLGHPGMPPRGMGGPGGMFPGQPPPGPPGGYFGPPGFGPMGMPRTEDPRLMMGPPRRPEYEPFNRDPNAPRPNMRPGDMYQM